MKQLENETERYYLPDEQKIMNMAESNTEPPRMDRPVDIDLSDFKKPKQSIRYRAAVILFIGLVVVIIASVLLFIRSKMEVSGTQQNSWLKTILSETQRQPSVAATRYLDAGTERAVSRYCLNRHLMIRNCI